MKTTIKTSCKKRIKMVLYCFFFLSIGTVQASEGHVEKDVSKDNHLVGPCSYQQAREELIRYFNEHEVPFNDAAEERALTGLIVRKPDFVKRIVQARAFHGADLFKYVVEVEKDPEKRFEKIKFLIDIGVSPNDKCRTRDFVFNVLLSQRDVTFEEVQFLTQHGADYTVMDRRGGCLQYMQPGINPLIVKHLLQHGANPQTICGDRTILHFWALYNYDAGIKELCNHERETVLKNVQFCNAHWLRLYKSLRYWPRDLDQMIGKFIGNKLCQTPSRYGKTVLAHLEGFLNSEQEMPVKQYLEPMLRLLKRAENFEVL